MTLSLVDVDQVQSGSSADVLVRLAGRGAPATRYRLEGEIGHGGMGAVLGVWDEDLRRHLAMKVMLAKSAGATPDPKLLARFLEEAQVTGQLDHPGIVPVHELGLDAEGRVYFTMKLVKGKTLRDVFDELARGEGGWTQARVLSLLLKVCEAMSYAHAKGVIHRDLKPANVMVGRFGEVFVMDWGLAKVIGHEDAKDLRIRSAPVLTSEIKSDRHEHVGEAPDSPLYTMDGDVVGTPAYMPPEQAAGRVEEIGPAADVYALGAMLYHLIAGHMPYLLPGTRATNYAIWRWVQEGPPKTLHQLSPSTPAELVAICEKAMSREISARYPDMAALAEDLAAYVEGRVVRAYEAGAWAEAKKWVRRNTALAAALAAGVLVLVAGLATSSGLYVRAENNAQQAFTNAEAAKKQERIATARADDVLRLSALQDLQGLIDEADALWPPHPESIASYGDWIRRAQALVAELPQHRAKREELQVPAPAAAEEPRLAERESQWWVAQLTKLIAELEGLQSGLLAPDATTAEHGWSVAKRLAFAQELESGFAAGGAYASAWERDLPALHAAYPGLDLEVQLGLVPIGSDPQSGLWEFAHLATGEPAQRGVDKQLVLTESTGAVLVLIPGGKFWMGAQSSDPSGQNYDPEARVEEGPVHEIEVSAYFLSKYELTQGQWLQLTHSNPSYYTASTANVTPLHPVEQMTWLECQRWLPRFGLALPSEAQWEYSARAGTDTPWWTGAERESLQEHHATNLADQAAAEAGAPWPEIHAWDDGHALHAPVGTYAPNAFGLHEVHGNVWEWCLDGFEPNFYSSSPSKDPVASWEDSDYRVYRGGGFAHTATHARTTMHAYCLPADGDDSLGVRPARAVTE